jgi:hypothetical protein
MSEKRAPSRASAGCPASVMSPSTSNRSRWKRERTYEILAGSDMAARSALSRAVRQPGYDDGSFIGVPQIVQGMSDLPGRILVIGVAAEN